MNRDETEFEILKIDLEIRKSELEISKARARMENASAELAEFELILKKRDNKPCVTV